MHRLWYDLRNQALFEDGFRDTIIAIDGLLADMVWAVVRAARRASRRDADDRPRDGVRTLRRTVPELPDRATCEATSTRSIRSGIAHRESAGRLGLTDAHEQQRPAGRTGRGVVVTLRCVRAW